MTELLSAFDVARSSYAYRNQRTRRINREKERLKAKVIAIEQAQNDIADYIRYYNYERGHSYNQYVAPALAEAA